MKAYGDRVTYTISRNGMAYQEVSGRWVKKWITTVRDMMLVSRFWTVKTFVQIYAREETVCLVSPGLDFAKLCAPFCFTNANVNASCGYMNRDTKLLW